MENYSENKHDPPMPRGGKPLLNPNNFAYLYHLSIKWHVECVAVIEKQ